MVPSTDQVLFDANTQLPTPGDPRSSSSLRLFGNHLANRSMFLLARVSELLGQYATVGTYPTQLGACNTTTGQFSMSANPFGAGLAPHGLSLNQPVRLIIGAQGGSVPTNTPVDTIFYVVFIDAFNFGLATSANGPQLTNLGGALSGESYVVSVNDSASRLFFPAVGSLAAGSLRSLLALVGYLDQFNTWTNVNQWNAPSVFSGGTVFSGVTARSGVSGRYIKRAPLIVGDGDATVDTTNDVIILTANSQQRNLFLRQTSTPVPFIGESLRVISLSGSVGSWVIKREGSLGAAIVTHAATVHSASDFEVRDGGGLTPHWTLGPTTGTPGADAD